MMQEFLRHVSNHVRSAELW